jgi:hypothetical protein
MLVISEKIDGIQYDGHIAKEEIGYKIVIQKIKGDYLKMILCAQVEMGDPHEILAGIWNHSIVKKEVNDGQD